MFEKFKANILFDQLLKRHDISKAYKMVGPEDSWYDTISTVHKSLAQIQQLPHEQLQITSFDGLKLKAVNYPGESDKTVIWVHGYTSHAERESAFPGLFYHSLGFNVLIPYLRAHGPSEGKFISFGPLEAKDIMDWVDVVNQKMPDGSILLHGLSMGGGIVLDLASREMQNVKALIADAPNVTVDGILRNVARDVFKKDHGRVVDFALQRYQKEFGCNAEDYDRVESIRFGRYPLLLSAGSNENMDDTLAQIKANNPMDTTVLILPGCNHGNGMYKQTEMFQGTIKEFLEENLR